MNTCWKLAPTVSAQLRRTSLFQSWFREDVNHYLRTTSSSITNRRFRHTYNHRPGVEQKWVQSLVTGSNAGRKTAGCTGKRVKHDFLHRRGMVVLQLMLQEKLLRCNIAVPSHRAWQRDREMGHSSWSWNTTNLQPREWRGVLTFPNVVRRSNVTEYCSSLKLIDWLVLKLKSEVLV